MRDDDQLEEFLAGALEVHEEERDEERLRGRDDEGNGGVEHAEVDFCDFVGEEGPEEECDPDPEVGFQR